MDDPKSLEAQLLGDMTYSDPRRQNVQPQYQELSDEQIAILQQQRAAAGQPPYTEEEIADLKAEFINRQRIQAQEAAIAAQAAAQQQAAAALLSEPETYQQPEKKPVHEALPQVDASALLEEPAPEAPRPAAFNQEDLEAAKRAAAKRASDSLKDIPERTAEEQKRAREDMALLRLQQQEALAEKGFGVSIAMTVIGALSGVCTFLYSTGAYSDTSMKDGAFGFFDKIYMLLGVLLFILSFTIVTRVKKIKGLTSGIFILTSILLFIPGIVQLISVKAGAEGGVRSIIFYILAIIGCLTVTFTLSTSDKLNAYYKKSDIIYD
ncbi:MAG: hypothetical protein IKX57_08520 [Oscillospiraceae bacterium]|nr:hypothetical protein [Oscillospiraceae bacterium]